MAYNPVHRKTRRNYLKSVLMETGDLICAYCKQSDLIIFHGQDPEIPPTRRASLDHIVSMGMGGSKYDRNNWQVLCERCNSLKGVYENPNRKNKGI